MFSLDLVILASVKFVIDIKPYSGGPEKGLLTYIHSGLESQAGEVCHILVSLLRHFG